MNIRVTKSDIQEGEPHDSCNCPVARAATRAYGFPVKVVISSTGGKKGNLRYFLEAASPWMVRKLNPDAINWIARYDAFGKEDAREFEFTMPDPPGGEPCVSA